MCFFPLKHVQLLLLLHRDLDVVDGDAELVVVVVELAV